MNPPDEQELREAEQKLRGKRRGATAALGGGIHLRLTADGSQSFQYRTRDRLGKQLAETFATWKEAHDALEAVTKSGQISDIGDLTVEDLRRLTIDVYAELAWWPRLSGGEVLMTSYPHPHRAHLHWPRVNLWLVAVVVLAAALIGLGAWVLVDRYTGVSTATENATSLIDNFNAAISRNDGKAIAALLTSDAVFFQRGSSLSGANAIAKLIAGHAGAKSVTRIAPVSVNGEYATTFIHFWGLGGVEDWPQLEVFQIKDGKIARIWGFLLGETPPFENIARS